jgi:hypothetical protein
VRALRPLLAVFTVGALSLAFTACGGDDGGSPLTAGNGEQSAEDLAESIEQAADDAADDATDGDGELSADEIDEAIENAEDMGLSEVCASAIYLSAAMTGAVTDQEFESEKFFDKAKDSVPDDLEGDLDLVAEWWKSFDEIVEANGGDVFSAMMNPEVQEELEALDTPEFEAANDRFGDWLAAECGGDAN